MTDPVSIQTPKKKQQGGGCNAVKRHRGHNDERHIAGSANWIPYAFDSATGCSGSLRIAQRVGESVGDSARAYYAIGARFGFDWLRETARRINSENEWQTMAVSAMVDELYDQQASLTGSIIDTAGGAAAVGVVLEAWEESREHDVSRVNQTLQDFRRADVVDLAMLSVATRHIRALIEE